VATWKSSSRALKSLEQEASDIVSTSSVQARQRVEVARERFAEEFHELEENCRQELERELERLSQEWEQRRQEELESYSKQLSKLGTELDQRAGHLAKELLESFLGE